MIRKVTTPAVPEPPGDIFSQCLVTGSTVHVSGQHAGAPGGGVVGDGGTADQFRESLRRVVALVEAAGGTAADIVKLTIYITRIEDRPALAAVRREFFSDPMPCSTLVGVNALVAPELRVEVDATAVLPSGRG